MGSWMWVLMLFIGGFAFLVKQNETEGKHSFTSFGTKGSDVQIVSSRPYIKGVS